MKTLYNKDLWVPRLDFAQRDLHGLQSLVDYTAACKYSTYHAVQARTWSLHQELDHELYNIALCISKFASKSERRATCLDQGF